MEQKASPIKSISSKAISLISKQALLSSFLISALFAFVYIAVNHFEVFSTNDDYCIFRMIYSGETGINCIGFFFASFISIIQPLFGNLNSYSIVMELIILLSLTALNYIIIAKFKSWFGVFLTLAFNAVFASFPFTMIFYNYGAAFASSSGLLLMLYGLMFEERKRFRIIQLVCGFILAFTGAQIRFPTVLSAFAVAAAMVCGIVLVTFLKLKKDKKLKDALVQTVKKHLRTVIVLIAVIVTLYGSTMLSNALKYTVDGFREYSEYNTASSRIIDYATAPYKGNESFYNSLGIKSKGEIDLVKNWYIDDEFYTVEKLKAISDYYSDKSYSKVPNRDFAGYIVNTIADSVSSGLESGLLFVFIFAMIIAVFAVVFLSLLIPKHRGVIIRVGLLAIIWLITLAIIGGFSSNIILLPLVALTIYAAFRYDNYQFIAILPALLISIALYLYLFSLRLFFYTALPVLLPIFAAVIFALDEDAKQEIKTKKGRILPILLSLLILASSVYAGSEIYSSVIHHGYSDANKKLAEYISRHPENVYAVNQTTMYYNYFNPIVLTEKQPNVINFGLWIKKSKYVQDAYRQNGITNIFRDSIDSNVRIVYTLSTGVSGRLFGVLEEYLNNHYPVKGKTIRLKIEKMIDGYHIIKVITEKTEQTEQ